MMNKKFRNGLMAVTFGCFSTLLGIAACGYPYVHRMIDYSDKLKRISPIAAEREDTRNSIWMKQHAYLRLAGESSENYDVLRHRLDSIGRVADSLELRLEKLDSMYVLELDNNKDLIRLNQQKDDLLRHKPLLAYAGFGLMAAGIVVLAFGGVSIIRYFDAQREEPCFKNNLLGR